MSTRPRRNDPARLPWSVERGAIRLAGVLAALVALAACFSQPSYVGKSCSPGGSCPGSLICDTTEICREAMPGGGTTSNGAISSTSTGACAEGQVRPCYDGPSKSAMLGACHPGTEVCRDGNFGACEGEVLPGVDRCDGLDESCDGVPDQGCPSGAIAFDAQTIRTSSTGVGGQPAWNPPACPAPEVVVGIQGQAGSYIDRLQALCALPVVAVNRATTPFEYTLALHPSSPGAAHGGAGGEAYQLPCPPGQILTGIFGRSGAYIDQISLICASFSLGTAPGPKGDVYAIIEVPSSRGPLTKSSGGTGGRPFSLSCPTGYIADLGGSDVTAPQPPQGAAPVFVGSLQVTCRRLVPGIR